MITLWRYGFLLTMLLLATSHAATPNGHSVDSESGRYTDPDNAKNAESFKRFTCRGTAPWGIASSVRAEVDLARRGNTWEMNAKEHLNGGEVGGTVEPGFDLVRLSDGDQRFLRRTYEDNLSNRVAWVQKLVDVGAEHGNRFLIYKWFDAEGRYVGASGQYGITSFACHEGPAFGVRLGDKLKIDRVIPNSVSESAGLRKEDVITAIDGKVVKDSSDFQKALKGHKPGDRIHVGIVRSGQELQITLKLGDFSNNGMDDEIPGIGITYALNDPDGYQIDSIVPGGAAEAAGIRVGDILTKLDKYPTNGDWELGHALYRIHKEKRAKASLIRDGRPIELEIPIRLGNEPDEAELGARGVFHSNGIELYSVIPGGEAESAGLKQYDVLTVFDGHPVRTKRDWIHLLRSHKPGDVVGIEFIRKGVVYTQEISLGRLVDY